MKLKNKNRIKREIRQETAAVRQAEHATLSVAEKLAKLDARLGLGQGAGKERARLAKQSSKGVTQAVAASVFGVKDGKSKKTA